MNQSVARLKQTRAEKLTAMEAILAKAEGDDRDLDEAELEAYGDLEKEVSGLSTRIERSEKVASLKAASAKPVSDSGDQDVSTAAKAAAGVTTQSQQSTQPAQAKSPTEKGELFGQYVRGLALGSGNAFLAAQIAEQRGFATDVVKALGAGSTGSGEELVPTQFANEFIDLLRPASVFRRANPRSLQFDGSGIIQFPRLTGGVNAGYVGENTNVGYGEATFDNVTLAPKKLAALTAVSRELLTRSRPGVDALIRDDLLASTATVQDARMLGAAAATATAPGGLVAAAVAAGNAINANATVNLANVTNDLRALITKLRMANVAMRRPAIFMSPRTELYLSTVRDGNGNLAFSAEMQDGTIMRLPYFVTTNIPANLDTSGLTNANESDIILADMDQVMLADEISVAVQVSDQAAYHDGSNVVSAFSQDQTAVKVVTSHDMALRHAEAVAVLRQVTWGAE